MMLMKLFPALLVALIILISGCTSQTTQGKYSPVNLPPGVPATGNTPLGSSVGDKAPDFTLTATDGRVLNLSQLKGKTVVLYFMATWCPFCKEEYGEIIKAFPAYGNTEFISVSIDMNENAQTLDSYRKQYNRPGLFAPGNAEILNDYNVIYTTTKYVISKDGVILYKGSGVLSSDNWKIIFDALANN